MSIKKVILPNKEIRWEVCERLVGQGQKRLRRRFERKVDAQLFLDDFKARKKETFKSGSSTTTSDIEGTTFNTEADYWLEKKSDYFSKGYFRVINPALKVIRELYGNYSVSRFSPMLLLEFRLYLKSEGLGPSTQNRYVDLITRIISFSHKQKRINANPCLGYEKAREPSEGMQFWDDSEVSEFLSFANKKYPRGSEKRWIYCAYLVALETGVRARELWGLKIKDLPKSGTKMKISRQVIGKDQFIPTKGKDARFVPYSYGLREELNAFQRHENIEVNLDRTLFVSTSLTPIDHDNFTDRVFRKDVEQCGIRAIRFHDLRHTAITLMVKRGIVLPVVQKVAGHKDVKTTMRYVHILGKDVEDVGAYDGLCEKAEAGRLLKMV